MRCLVKAWGSGDTVGRDDGRGVGKDRDTGVVGELGGLSHLSVIRSQNRFLTSSPSLGVPVPHTTQCIRDV